MDRRSRRIQKMFVVAAGFGLLFAIGCGSTKMTAKASGEKIFQADKIYLDAKAGNASMNAKEALEVAEGKLAKAKDAFAKGNYDEAARMAEQVVVDADYASAKARTQGKLNTAEEIKKQNDALRREIEQLPK